MKCNDSDHRVIACYLESYEEYAVEGLKVKFQSMVGIYRSAYTTDMYPKLLLGHTPLKCESESQIVCHHFAKGQN